MAEHVGIGRQAAAVMAVMARRPPPRPAVFAPPTGSGALAVPDGVRLVLKLSAGQAVSGTLTRDWVTPDLGGNS